MEKTPQFRIYKGVVCLELRTPNGRHWWDQGYELGFSPCRLDRVTHVRAGKLEGSYKKVLAVRTPVDGAMRWVAVNLARSDMPALKERGVWPPDWPEPYAAVETYSPWPEELP